MPWLAFPFALAASVALPALAAIYLFRSRHRKHPVSGLFLWVEPEKARKGGRRLSRPELPWLFLVELLILALLVFAAVDPRWPVRATVRPAALILDDSASMGAGGSQSARDRAWPSLRRELQKTGADRPLVVLAGVNPTVLGRVDLADLSAVRRAWTATQPEADLEAAQNLVLRQLGPEARILVVADRAPSEAPAPGQVRWLAFGEPRPNLGFVAAARTARDDGDLVFFEVANMSDQDREAAVTVGEGDGRQVRRLAIPAGEVARDSFTVPWDAPPLRLALEDDAMAHDNQVTLLPAPRPRIRLATRLSDPEFSRMVDSAVEAAAMTVPYAFRPEVFITDDRDAAAPPGAWVVRLIRPDRESAAAYRGPFVTDRRHPLTDGLNLEGVIWGGPAEPPALGAGWFVVSTGPVPLVIERPGPGGAVRLDLHLDPDLSTLGRSPAWPALVWNLLRWRAEVRPGVLEPNLRMGMEARVRVPEGVETVEVARPGEASAPVTPARGEVRMPLDASGIWTVSADEWSAQVQANFLSPAQTDLRDRTSGAWGSWVEGEFREVEFPSTAWWFLLPALGLLGIHLAAVRAPRVREW